MLGSGEWQVTKGNREYSVSRSDDQDYLSHSNQNEMRRYDDTRYRLEEIYRTTTDPAVKSDLERMLYRR